MTNKDVLKMLLCYYGYDRNIQIDSFYGEGGCIGYEVHAENKDGDFYEEANCEGIMFHIHCIINYMNKNNIKYKYKWMDMPSKYILNDSLREKSIKLWDEQDEKIRQSIERDKPIFEWIKNNNPCPKCTINKKDHWDSVHYNCELCHTHNCSLLDKWRMDEVAFRKQHMENQKNRNNNKF